MSFKFNMSINLNFASIGMPMIFCTLCFHWVWVVLTLSSLRWVWAQLLRTRRWSPCWQWPCGWCESVELQLTKRPFRYDWTRRSRPAICLFQQNIIYKLKQLGVANRIGPSSIDVQIQTNTNTIWLINIAYQTFFDWFIG